MEIGGKKISALPELGSEQVTDMVVLSYLDDAPKKNYRVPYKNIKDRLCEDIIDQHYDPASTNAQSGIAVEEAIQDLNNELSESIANNTTYIDNIKNELQSELDKKASKDELNSVQEELKNELDTKANQSDFEELTETVNNKADRTELTELEVTINEKLDQKVDVSFMTDVSLRFESVTNNINSITERVESTENTLNGLDDRLDEFKKEVDNTLAQGAVSKEYVDQELAKKLDKEGNEDVLQTLEQDVSALREQNQNLDDALALKADKTELPPINERIDEVEDKIPEVDEFVTSTSSNPVTSSGIYDYISAQGFLTSEDISQIDPFVPESITTPAGDTNKQVYWFVVDKSYFNNNKGYLSNIRIYLGEQEEPEDNEEEDEDMDFGTFISLIVCKWDGNELVELGGSFDVVTPADNTWASFSFENKAVPITSEDNLAFIFTKNVYGEEVTNPIAKLAKVGLMCSSSSISGDGIYTGNDSNDSPVIEKFIPQIEISYTKPIQQTLDDEVTETSDAAVKSSGIYKFVKDNNSDLESRVTELEKNVVISIVTSLPSAANQKDGVIYALLQS